MVGGKAQHDSGYGNQPHSPLQNNKGHTGDSERMPVTAVARRLPSQPKQLGPLGDKIVFIA